MSILDDKVEFEVSDHIRLSEPIGLPVADPDYQNVRAMVRLAGMRYGIPVAHVDDAKEAMVRQLNDMVYGDIRDEVIELYEMVMANLDASAPWGHESVDKRFRDLLEKLS